jgi:hypothetical protein
MMNDKINQLLVQSGLLINVSEHRVNELDPNIKKFAELIIRECAEVCYDHSNAAGGIDTHFGYGYKDCGDDIKRNFGVEV